MLKNMSVSTKGFAAFAILALIAIAASGFIYTRVVTATHLVEHSHTMGELLSETSELTDKVNQANLALKNFLLTGIGISSRNTRLPVRILTRLSQVSARFIPTIQPTMSRS